ncbi:MAG: HAD family hydrolase [Lawsonibacter sp.]|jgi:phosphoglycolate phosphatase
MKPYKAVCFDFDYTLGDATDSIVAGFQYAFPLLGWPAPSREDVRNTIGYLLEDAYTMLTGDSDPEHRAQFRPLFLSVARDRQREETVLFPGAVELLLGLKAQGIKAAIVSTKRGDTIDYIMQRFHVRHTLDSIVGSEHVHHPKPDPQGLLDTMAHLGVKPEETLFCGDTILDAGAAKNAGCSFCAVLNGTTEAQEFASYAPVYIASNLHDLAQWLELE